MRIKLGATIPTVAFGNIQPEFEIDENDMANGKGIDYVEGKIQDLWAKYGDKPLQVSSTAKRLKAFAGGEIDYDNISHTYTWNGQKYLSGSAYARQFDKPFDTVAISGAMAKKWDVDATDIQAMWKLKSEVSKGFGTAIHAALELYGRYSDIAAKLEKTTHLHDHPVIQKAVEEFYKGRKDEKAIYEALIIDHENKRAGQVDRLLVTSRKTCRIQDYKTNASIAKNIDTYWHQLSFYAAIMVANGWTVEGLDIFHWDGEWHTYQSEVKELV
ncbi:PD-(D/E)XK nuclease family protein [Candidatus Saccharibacteria bacterium]|nr:PD-(D/E)XK nuclease family protein [Candidatus Saccharibacteria bacterium]